MQRKDPKLSQTMRIDLIPDIPTSPGKKVMFTPPTRSYKPIKLDAQEAPHRQLLQSMYDGVLITDLKGRIVDCNIRVLEFLNYERDELCSITIFDVIAGSDEALIHRIWETLKQERFVVIEAYCIRSDKTFFPAEIAVNKFKLKDINLCFFIRDTTLRRQREEMLRTTYRAIENASTGIGVINLDGIIEYVNPACARMWEYKAPAEMVGKVISDLFRSEKEIIEMFQESLSQNVTCQRNFVAVKADGTTFDAEVSCSSNKNSEGDVVGMVLSFVDISDRKRAEEAEREAERQKVMLASLGAACHHLGQPATVILANLGLLVKRIGNSVTDPLTRELVESSLKAAENLAEILHRLNSVNEFKTTLYLEREGGESSAENVILQI